MKAAKEQGVTIHQYNLLEFEEGWDKYGIDQTPTLVSYENGKQADVKIGEDSEAGFASFLEKHKK